MSVLAFLRYKGTLLLVSERQGLVHRLLSLSDNEHQNVMEDMMGRSARWLKGNNKEIDFEKPCGRSVKSYVSGLN